MDATTIIKLLNLTKLPEEGGYYRETYRDPLRYPAGTSPHHQGPRHASTCIYYLVTPEEFSGLHAVNSTEIFHFYGGDPVKMIQIDQQGHLTEIVLGSDIAAGQLPQLAVPAQVWQGTKLLGNGKWALLGCTVAPGFEFSDFHGGNFASLSKLFPQHTNAIRDYTHG